MTDNRLIAGAVAGIMGVIVAAILIVVYERVVAGRSTTRV